jgi:hypothetical protein
METLTTIRDNLNTLANANIDWSPTAGPIWLVGMTVGFVAVTFLASLRSN